MKRYYDTAISALFAESVRGIDNIDEKIELLSSLGSACDKLGLRKIMLAKDWFTASNIASLKAEVPENIRSRVVNAAQKIASSSYERIDSRPMIAIDDDSSP